MRILVAGSEGSLMQWTIKHLLSEGHAVVGIDNQSRYEEEMYDAMKLKEDYEYVKGDLTDYSLLEDITNIDAIIQGAAMIYGVKGFHEHPADILSNDLELHRNMYRFARERNVNRFVYISSSMVYETGEPPHKEDEVFELKIPSTDYGLSKVVGERMCMAYQNQYDIDYTIWRPFNIITPYEKGEKEEGMSHVFADFIRKIINKIQHFLGRVIIRKIQQMFRNFRIFLIKFSNSGLFFRKDFRQFFDKFGKINFRVEVNLVFRVFPAK